MRNIRLDISYDGTAYHGWQRQKGQATIQGTIEEAIQKMTGEETALTGSGRTDAGVHALCQTANFFTSTTIPTEGFVKGLNSLLPRDIAILEAAEVPSDFHARKSAKGKTYMYRIVMTDKKLPLVQNRAWTTAKELDTEAMTQTASVLTGTHDFSSFMAAGSSVKTTVRTVKEIRILSTTCAEYGPMGISECQIFITANGFLRYMVRNMVALLHQAGLGLISHKDAKQVLEASDRSAVPPTAPSCGLYLVRVHY